MQNTNLQLVTIEKMTIDFCSTVQKYCKQLDLSFTTIQDVSAMLVELTGVKRDLELLRSLNAKHEVIDQRTGKVIGELYDNEKIEGVMMATNISVNSWIDSCEWEIARLTKKLII